MAGVPAGLLRMTLNLNKPPVLLQEIRISNRVEGVAAAPGWPNCFSQPCPSMAFRLSRSARLRPWRINDDKPPGFEASLEDWQRIRAALLYMGRDLQHRSFAVTAERRPLLWEEQDRCLALAERLERWLEAGADGPAQGG